MLSKRGNNYERAGKKGGDQLRIKKARETFNEVKVLVDNEFWNTTVNRIYYACFYAVTANTFITEIEKLLAGE